MLTPSVQREHRLVNALRDAVVATGRSDVLLIQRPGRRREEGLLLRLAAGRAQIVAIDVDDPVAETGVFGWAVPRADVVLAASRALERSYEGRVGQVVRIRTGLDVGLYDLPKASRSRPVIGWIGDGPAYAEPLERMIAAVSPAPDQWQLWVVGTKRDESLERALRRAAGDVPLTLVGEIEWQNEQRVAETVAQFEVGLAPFRSAEGASFKTAQYLAAGAVPLAEEGGEAEEQVRAALGHDAPVVPVGDHAAVQRMLEVLADPGFRARLATRGKAAAAKLYSREAVASLIDETFRRALGQSSW
jgi:glycosyltransferase involved in cell wall biosynthesis